MGYIERGEEVLLKTYNRFPVVLERGEGVYLYDTEGKKYLDFGSGIGVFALGYGNERYNQALKGQIDRLLHTSNLFYNEKVIGAAETIVKTTGLSKVFFTNSGTEAIEGALKLARKYAYEKDPSKEYEVIAMKHGFHGRSQGALSVTGTAKYREGMIPSQIVTKFATFNDLEDVKKKINENTCCIITEVIQGEGGIYPATKEFLQGLRELCDEHDILLIFDEIQCGMGRCGTMYAHEQYSVKPDVMTLAKSLGCGIPVGAFVVSDKYEHILKVGDHGTTYGGNPFAACAVETVFQLYKEENILEYTKEIGSYFDAVLETFAKEHPFVIEHRGIGLMQGLQFDISVPVSNVIKKALEKGLILLSAGNNTLRFLPPLVIKKEDIDRMICILEKCV